MKPSKYLYVPMKNGEWLFDSQLRARIYRTAATARANLKRIDYDTMQVFAVDYSISRVEFERLMSEAEE